MKIILLIIFGFIVEKDDYPYPHQQLDELSNRSQFDSYYSGVIRPDYSFNLNELEDSFNLNELDYTMLDSGSSINILENRFL